MSAEELILIALSELGVTPIGPIVSGRDSQPVYFVTIRVARDGSGRQTPSNQGLHSTSRALKEAGISVEFILTYEETEDIESGLRATILHSHIDHIRNIFVSVHAARADVWLEPKHPLDGDTLRLLEDRAKTFLNLFEIDLVGLKLTTEEILPSKLALLTTIRQNAPASLATIAAELSRRELTIPSPDWLDRRLDALRKVGQVVRLTTGKYTLTQASLHALGTAKNRNSPDISRLLALSRRGS